MTGRSAGPPRLAVPAYFHPGWACQAWAALADPAAPIGLVVLNPGVLPEAEYLDLADVVVTFEGPWADYREPGPIGPGRPP